MKVKNVIKGPSTKYALQEVTIIDEDKIIYSGTLNGWIETTPDMIIYKRNVEGM